MNNTELLIYKVNKLVYENHIINEKKFEIASNIQAKVNYDKVNHKCLCTYNIKMFDKENIQPFNIEVEIIGFFSYSDDMKKEDVHISVAHELFSYLRSTVSSLTAAAGITPIIIPQHNISIDEITDTKLNIATLE